MMQGPLAVEDFAHTTHKLEVGIAIWKRPSIDNPVMTCFFSYITALGLFKCICVCVCVCVGGGGEEVENHIQSCIKVESINLEIGVGESS